MNNYVLLQIEQKEIEGDIDEHSVVTDYFYNLYNEVTRTLSPTEDVTPLSGLLTVFASHLDAVVQFLVRYSNTLHVAYTTITHVYNIFTSLIEKNNSYM